MFGRGDRENRKKVESSHEPHAIQTDMTKACKLPYSSPDPPDLNGNTPSPHLPNVSGRGDREDREMVKSSHEPLAIQTYMIQS